jgi:ribonuclease-3
VETEPDVLADCQAALEYTFTNLDHLRLALVHASSTDDRAVSNERMEFLGDAILGAVVSEQLYVDYPAAQEGELTRIKSAVVSREGLARASERIDLGRFLTVGKGIAVDEPLPDSVLAGAFESVVAAVYLDGGLEPARTFILRLLKDDLQRVAEDRHRRNYKSLLQHYAQRHLGRTPAYRVLEEQGPQHSRAFRVAAVVGDRTFPAAWGPSKKDAEQAAAKAAYDFLAQPKRKDEEGD